MNDVFNKTLWELASTSPDLQEALKKSMRGAGYSIPTRTHCKATGEVEDIHFSALDIEDAEKRERFLNAVKSVDSMKVGEIAKLLNYARVAIVVKEAEGEELTEVEKTLKDIDFSLLAMFIVKVAPKTIGRTKPIKG